jgi:D-alanyl-D-alanine dipeptidase
MNQNESEIQNDQAARRAFWAQQMDLAYDFMAQMRTYPVVECGENLRSMTEAVAEAKVEVLFSTSKIAGDLDRVFFLREGLIPNFMEAARSMNERGWILKIEDGFRTLEMQTALSRKPGVFDAILKSTMWELNGAKPDPEFLLKRLSVLTATRPKVGTHMSGSAMDISVWSRDSGQEIERGGPYLEMSELTPMRSPFVSQKALDNRNAITEIMERNGFVAYPFEFWHYNSGDAYGEFLTKTGKPARYGAIHLDQKTGASTPVADPDEALQTPEVMQREMQAALTRLTSEPGA